MTRYDVCWIDENKFIYNKESDLFLYDIRDKSDKLFVKNAGKVEWFN